MENRWYYQMLMEEFGPVSETMIRQLLQDGTLSPGDLIRAENSSDWVPVGTLPSDESQPDDISDLSELSFDFEESAHQERQARPPAAGPAPFEAPPEFYTQSLGQVLGPMSMTDLLGMAESGALCGADEIKLGLHGTWMLASGFADLKNALHQGASIVSEPVASAPPSTRRLFQTAGKTVDTDNPVANVIQADLTQEFPETTIPAGNTPPATEGAATEATATEATKAKTADLNTAADAAAATETRGARPAADAESRPVARKVKKKKSKNQEDDKLLDDIFDDVFAETPKSPRGPLPGISSAPGVAAAAGLASSGVSGGSSSGASGAVSAAEEVGSPPTTAPAAVQAPPMMRPPTVSPPITPIAPAPYKPVPSGSSGRGFSFDGPLRSITLGLVGIILVGGLIWKVGLPLMTGIDTGKYSTRMTAVLADFKALGEEPQASAWQDLALKSRVEFMTYYKAMLEAGANGPENVACMEGLKNVIALSSTKAEEKDKRKELLDKLEKAVAGLGK